MISKKEFDFAVIGGGPAGLSASIEAALHGLRVLLIDENDELGGQLFTQTHKFFGSRKHKAGTRGFKIANDLVNRVNELKVDVLTNSVVWGIFPDKRIAVSIDDDRNEMISAKNILISTGGLEKPLFFPGWTLPGVMGAGAAQTMMNIHKVLPGEKVVMVGSGNVGLIVAYQLKQAGADVLGVIEVLPEIGGYKVHASKIRRARISILTSHIVKKALGKNCLESVIISRVDKDLKCIRGTEIEIDCDLLCIAAGLQPFSELCWSMQLEMKYSAILGGFLPVHDQDQEASVKGIFVAGDVTGIEEASTAMDEGKLVGLAVANRLSCIDDDRFKNEKETILNNLNELRLGSFGEKRHREKEMIIDQCIAWRNR